MTKLAVGVPVHSSTRKLLGIGRRNTVYEMVEAHLSNQRIRLSQTEHGRAFLRKLVWRIEPQPDTETLPAEWEDVVKAKPLSRNMQRENNEGRRPATARALARQLEEDTDVLYMGAAGPMYGTKATAVVTTVDTLVTCAAVRTAQPVEAEEVAVALALTHPRAAL